MMFEPEMIGAIKIKDGLFIGDELASTVRNFGFAKADFHHALYALGSRICGS